MVQVSVAILTEVHEDGDDVEVGLGCSFTSLAHGCAVLGDLVVVDVSLVDVATVSDGCVLN